MMGVMCPPLPPAQHWNSQIRPPQPLVEVVQDHTYIYGNSSRNCCHNPNSMAVVSDGWTDLKESSKSRTRFAWRVCGADVRTGQRWTTTNWVVLFVSTTKKESWKRLRDHSVWSTSSVTPTVCKSIIKIIIYLTNKERHRLRIRDSPQS